MHESREVEQLAFVADAGIAQVTPKGTILELNPAFSRILGRPAQEVIGRKLRELEPCVPHGVDDILRAFAKRTLTKPLELFQDIGGVSLLVVVRPFYAEEALRFVAITAVDITAARRTQRIAEDTSRAQRLVDPRSPRGRHLRILVADDNTINQRVASNLLTNMGHAAVVVDDGAGALDILKRERFDLVLMDIQMPVKDGLTATREIRSGASGVADAMVPIAAMTAHALEGDRESCLEAGMDDFLAKPIRPEELERIIERLVSKGQRPDLEDSGAWPIRDVVALERDWLVARYDGDADLADEAIRLFVDELCPAYLSQSQKAIEANRRDELAGAAHALWGACATVGAFRLQGICRELYESATTEPAEELRARWEDAYRGFLELKSV